MGPPVIVMRFSYKHILYIIIFLTCFYLSTLISSIIIISKSIDGKNISELSYYLQSEEIEENLRLFFYDKIISSLKKNYLNLEFNNFNFTGKISEESLDTLAQNISICFSKNLSVSESIIYFYHNPKKIDIFIDEVIQNNGNYSFSEFIGSYDLNPEKLSKNVLLSIERSDNENVKIQQNGYNNKLYNSIPKLVKKLKRSEFQFTNPWTIKLKLQHKSDEYYIFLKLNGIKWSVIRLDFNSILIKNDGN